MKPAKKMTTPKANSTCARAPQEQLLLLPTPPAYAIESNALARNAYGAIAQELACAALALSAIPIDGRCAICFDAERDGQFYEIKSVYRKGKTVLYDWRMEKERAYPSLLYCFVTHKARRASSAEALLSKLHEFLEFWLLPAPLVHAAARKCPLRYLQHSLINPRNGYNRAGYALGYRNVPLHFLACPSQTLIFFQCYGQTWTATLRS